MGIELGPVRFQFVANVTRYAPKHYVHVGLLADWASGQPRVLERDRCDDWSWYPVDSPPQPLFEMTRLALVALQENKACFDLGT